MVCTGCLHIKTEWFNDAGKPVLSNVCQDDCSGSCSTLATEHPGNTSKGIHAMASLIELRKPHLQMQSRAQPCRCLLQGKRAACIPPAAKAAFLASTTQQPP